MIMILDIGIFLSFLITHYARFHPCISKIPVNIFYLSI